MSFQGIEDYRERFVQEFDEKPYYTLSKIIYILAKSILQGETKINAQ